VIIIILLFCFYLEKREANLINMFLSTMTKHINMIEGDGLVESKEELCILWRKLALIWINCPNFQNYNYIIVLINVLCNMVMAEVSKTNVYIYYFILIKH